MQNIKIRITNKQFLLPNYIFFHKHVLQLTCFQIASTFMSMSFSSPVSKLYVLSLVCPPAHLLPNYMFLMSMSSISPASKLYVLSRVCPPAHLLPNYTFFHESVLQLTCFQIMFPMSMSFSSPA
jgi:hypothetical protein